MLTRVLEARDDGTVELAGFAGRWRQHDGAVTVSIPGAGTFKKITEEEAEELSARMVENREIVSLSDQIIAADPRDLPSSTLAVLRGLIHEHNLNRCRRLTEAP